MRSRLMQVLVVALALLVSGPWTASSVAATHYVAKDGTGQFTVIQDALDGAAEGDTIRIGAGRYDEIRELVTPPGETATLMWVHTPSLTIIGASRDSVIVGPEQLVHEVNGIPTIGMLVLDGLVGTQLSRVTIERVQWGVSLSEAAHLSDIQVRYASSAMVALIGTDGSLIEDSRFEWNLDNGQVSGIMSFVGHAIPNTVVRRCQFFGDRGTGVQFDGGLNGIIEDCLFDGANLGVHLLGSTGVTVRRCEIRDAQNFALGVQSFSEAVVEDCRIEGSLYRGLSVSGSTAVVNRTSINGGEFGAITLAGGVDVIMRDCDILNDYGPRVYSEASVEWTTQLDLRHNFWGSLDSLEIASWIDDGADDGPGDCPEYIYYCPRDTVEFWPVLERSVEAKPVPVSGLKGLYRRSEPIEGQN